MTKTSRSSSIDHTATRQEGQSLRDEKTSEPGAPPTATLPLPAADQTSPAASDVPVPRKSCSELLNDHFLWVRMGNIKTKQESPLTQYLYDNRTLPKGWLRREEALRAGLEVPNDKSHLSQREKQTAFSLKCALASTPFLDQNTMAPMKHFVHAWGRNRGAFTRMLSAVLKNDNFVCERKARSEKGQCVITSPLIQKREFTPLNYYKKVMNRRRATEPLESRTAAILKMEFDLLEPNERRTYELGAKAELERAQHLPEQIRDAFRHLKGSITWHGLEAYLSTDGIPIVSKEALRRYCKGNKKFFV
mmetsp:Transcript_21536/g.33196  ORF Transcript_21536/g.33196 Transcript_21536/m.33196 type:complete len:305 (-) Transcript_21536:265-1179(-)